MGRESSENGEGEKTTREGDKDMKRSSEEPRPPREQVVFLVAGMVTRLPRDACLWHAWHSCGCTGVS